MRPFSSRLAGLLLAAALASLVAAQTPWPLPSTTPAQAGYAPQRLERLHEVLRQRVDDQQYSGYITLLARDGQIVDWRAHGWQEVGQQVPLQRDSILRIYSMSKIITSAAVLILVEEGKLRLGDPVERFLPALKERHVFTGGTADAPQLEPARRRITVRDLLTHTAGYYYGETWSADAPLIELQQRAGIWQAHGLEDFVARVATLPLHDQPGTRYRYGIATDLLGAIIEKVSGQKLPDFLQERLFGPLDMRDTSFWVPAEKRPRLARVHRRNATGGLTPVDDAFLDGYSPARGFASGGGGLYSTAGDYARFAQMLLNGGELDGVRVLGRKTIELMTANHLAHLASPHPMGIPSQGFGLGVRVVNDLGASTLLGSLGTFGWDGAASTFVQIDPQERTVALLLCQHFPFNEDDLVATFTNVIYGALND